MNLLAYLKAGYVALAHCREEVAKAWVESKYEGSEVELKDEQFIIDSFLPSPYYYENETLFIKG